MKKQTLCIVLALMLPAITVADTVTIPFGTTVYCELAETVTSKKKQTAKGDRVRAHVWQDVWVDGHLVIEAGAPIYIRVDKVKKARAAGVKGKLELEALNVTAIDGSDVPLSGGYDKSGKGRMGLSITLAALVAWPLIFIRGKQAVLEQGTVFDAIIRSPVEVHAQDKRQEDRSTLAPNLSVTVLYDEMNPESKIKDLPLAMRLREGEVSRAEVVEINGKSISTLPIRLAGADDTGVTRGAVAFKPLSKHFSSGMNRFSVRAGEYTTEVLLEIEF